jgi:hypothetical protein
MTNRAQQTGRRTAITTWMIILQTLSISTFFIWLGFLMTNFSITRSLAGSKDLLTNTILCLYPIFPVVLSTAAWIAYARRKNKLAVVCAGLSAAPMFLILIAALSFLA